MDDIFQSYIFRTWGQVWMCLMLLNPNCLYSFRAVPFASLLQGGVYLLSQQLIEESYFLASPFSKAKDPANGLWNAEGKTVSTSWWLQRNSKKLEELHALCSSSSKIFMLFSEIIIKVWNFYSWSSSSYSEKERLKIISIFLKKIDLDR